MKYIKSLIIIISVAVLAMSCEKIIDIDIPDNEKKIVVNSVFCPDSLIWVNVSKSLNILDDQNVKFIENAKVQLFEDGEAVEDLLYFGGGFYRSMSFRPVHGKTYQVLVSSEGLTSVNAENEVPTPVHFISIDTSSSRFNDMDVVECKMRINDPANEANYYLLSVRRLFRYMDYDSTFISEIISPLWLESNDPVVEEWIDYGSGLLFSDDMIDGKNYDFSFMLYMWDLADSETDSAKVYFNLFSISKDYYLYAKSYQMNRISAGNPFAEPVQVYSNVNNGIGVFAGYSNYADSMIFVGYMGKDMYIE